VRTIGVALKLKGASGVQTEDIGNAAYHTLIFKLRLRNIYVEIIL